MFKISLLLLPLLMVMNTSFANANSCGKPDFDRTTKSSIFIWQNCGTNEWFYRQTGGGRPSGDELRVDGNLRLSKPFVRAAGFNLDLGDGGMQDLFDTSNPEKIKFRFRVFQSAQDGFDITLQPDTVACLKLTASEDVPIMIGANNLVVKSPVNLATLDSTGCNSLAALPAIYLLLE